MTDNKTEVILACSKSIETFGRLFMPNALSAATPPFHREIYSDLQDNSIKRLGIIAPRGHSKSTVVSVLFPMWRTIFKPQNEDLMILLVSESQSQAVNFLSIIKHNLENNPRILSYFGSLKGDKWTEDDITTSNGVRIIAKGTGQRIRGMLTGRESITRPNLIILDDFESETNSLTPEAIDKNIDWITKAVEPSMSDDGRLIAIGTIISERAYLSSIREDKAFKTRFYQAAIGDDFDNPLWPERFPPQRLKEHYESYKSRGKEDAFWQEYQNHPVNKNTQNFKREMFRYWSGEFRLLDDGTPAIRFEGVDSESEGLWTPLSVSVGIDLAISEDHRADWTVIAPLAMDYKERRFLLPHKKIKTSDIDEICESIIDVCQRYGAERVHIETVQFQQAVATALRKAMARRNVYLAVHETKPRAAKDSRLRALQPLFALGMFYHLESAIDFEGELLMFPRAKHDDIMDAVWYANDVLVPPILGPQSGTAPQRRDKVESESWLVL